MQILQPLDLDSTAGILQLNGYLVPLSEWSKAREGYKSNTDRRAFVIILCALIGLAVACMEYGPPAVVLFDFPPISTFLFF